jgi:hypothetical protein
MERLIVERGLNLQFWGLGAGFVVTLILSIGGIHLLNTGRNVEGLAAIIVPLAALVGAFFYVRRKETKDQSTTDSSIIT